MPKALVAYSSRNGATQDMAEYVAEGIRFAGVEAKLVDAGKIKKVEDLAGFDAYVFGSATYNGDMMQSMKALLTLAAGANLDGKVGGSFGAFGWSGEACDKIYNRMADELKMKMVGQSLRLKTVILEGGTKMAQDYGRTVGSKV